MKPGGWRAGLIIAASVAAILPGVAAAENISVYASAKVAPLARAWVTEFNRVSSDRATLEVRPSAAGVHALTAGVASVAIVDRPAWEAERRPHRVIFGTEPIAVRIGIRRTPAGHSSASIYVNAANPMNTVTRRDLARIFVIGNPGSDIGRWEQLKLGGRYAGRRIHLYGGRDDGGFATNLRLSLFGGRQFRASYEALADDRAAVAAVRDDPFGIAIVDELSSADKAGVKRVALAANADMPSAADPLAPFVLAYVTPGADRPPASTRFVRFLLSDAGQRVAARSVGFANIDATFLQAERSIVERIGDGPR